MASIINELFGKSEKQRTAPLGDSGLSDIQKVVDTNKAAKINGLNIDTATANVFVDMYNSLNDTNKAKMLKMNILTAMDTAWKLKNG